VRREQLEALLGGQGGFLQDVQQTVQAALTDSLRRPPSSSSRSQHHATPDDNDGGGDGGDGSGVSIDEVVLVGGCSLLPCVRATIKTTLMQAGVTAFGGKSGPSSSPTEAEGGKDFCCSVNPHECVAHGLAVRGALLMGVQESRLKQLLMLDAVPYTVGVMVHRPPALAPVRPDHGEDGKDDDWEFEPLLERGMPLPCTARKTFLLDSSSMAARRVSVDVYEETFAGSSLAPLLQLVSTCDLPIGHLKVVSAPDSDPSSPSSLTVDVVFYMLDSGEIKYSVEDSAANREVAPPRGGGGGGSKDEDASTLLLGFYLACLLVLYVVAKVVIVGDTALLADLQARGLDPSSTPYDEQEQQGPESTDVSMTGSEFDF
jgi:hypothetical protein